MPRIKLLVMVLAPLIASCAADTIPETAFVKGGCFEIGDAFGEGDRDERPAHTVCVDSFYMGKREVTQGEWKKIIGDNPSFFRGDDRLPVESVSWEEVQAFIQRLNQRTGRHYRLPTEAEWEYAARERGRKVRFGTGADRIGPDSANLNGSGQYRQPYSEPGAYRKKTMQVGSFKPNGLGLYDMAGNVWEWVSDRYDNDYYKGGARTTPKGPAVGQYRVIRGGSWGAGPRLARATNRNRLDPAMRINSVGFRLAMTP